MHLSFVNFGMYTQEPVLSQGLRKMVAQFEKTENLRVQPDRGLKSTHSYVGC